MQNNNPGNIKKGPSNWQGEIKPSTDPVFIQFQSMPYGVRASIKLLQNYYYNYDLKTIRQIIKRWSATDQESYINYVSQCMGVYPDQLLNMNRDTIINQVDCVFDFENQYNKPTYSELVQGYNML